MPNLKLQVSLFSTIKTTTKEIEQQLLQQMFMLFPCVKDLIIDYRIVLCLQKNHKQISAIQKDIELKADVYIKDYQNWLSNTYGLNVSLSEYFKITFIATLKALVEKSSFRDASMITLYKKIIFKKKDSVSHARMWSIVSQNKRELLEKARKVESFLDDESQAIIERSWKEVFEYCSDTCKIGRHAFAINGNISIISFFSAAGAYVFELLDGYLATALVVAGLLPFIIEMGENLYEDYFPDIEKSGEIVAMFDELCCIKKFIFPDEANATLESSISPSVSDNIKKAVAAVAELEPVLSDIRRPLLSTAPTAIQHDIKTKKNNDKKKRGKRKLVATIKSQSKSDRNVIAFPGTNYAYDPNNEEQSSAFPIGGSVGHDIFYVAIHPEVFKDIQKQLAHSGIANDVCDTCRTCISNNVKFGNVGQNLRTLGRVLQDRETGKQLLCYELRLIGKTTGDYRLIGTIKPTDDNRCLIELNTFCEGAHQGDHLTRSIERVQKKTYAP